MAITESSKVGQQLAEALRLPEQLVGFTLRCWVDEPLTVTAVYYPDVDEDQLQTVTTVLRFKQNKGLPELFADHAYSKAWD
jgi:hypothetical protein